MEIWDKMDEYMWARKSNSTFQIHPLMNLSTMCFEELFTAHSQREILTIEAYGIHNSQSIVIMLQIPIHIYLGDFKNRSEWFYMQLKAIYSTT